MQRAALVATIIVLSVLIVAAPSLLMRALKPSVSVTPAEVEATLRVAFPGAPVDWGQRLDQDVTLATCAQFGNAPPVAVADRITAREKARIVYPKDGRLIGDWKRGEVIAQSGYGLRFTDYPPTAANGGNCYACHQLSVAEVSHGTIGVSLLGYGKAHKYAEASVRAAYEKIYNSHAAYPCSKMPRFGANGVLSIEQIKDLVGLLMDPASPVNQ